MIDIQEVPGSIPGVSMLQVDTYLARRSVRNAGRGVGLIPTKGSILLHVPAHVIGDMSYWDGTNWVYENVDYENWGVNDARNGKASQVASVPASNQASYTEGFNFGTYWKNQLQRTQF